MYSDAFQPTYLVPFLFFRPADFDQASARNVLPPPPTRPALRNQSRFLRPAGLVGSARKLARNKAGEPV